MQSEAHTMKRFARTSGRVVVRGVLAADSWGGSALRAFSGLVSRKRMRSALVFLSASINILLPMFLAGLDLPGVAEIGAGCMAFGVFTLVFLWPAIEDEAEKNR